MTFTEIALLFAIAGNAVAVIAAVLKLAAGMSGTIATLKEKIDLLEREINNDIAGRRVVAEVREDVAAIKAQIVDIHEEIRHLRKQTRA